MKVRKFIIVSLIITILLTIISLIIIKYYMDSQNKMDDVIVLDNIKYTSTIKDGEFIIYPNKEPEQLTIKAVRLSSVNPNYERNQSSISKKKVKKWIKQIKEMNANTIIIPYIQPPSFYKAIYEYNLENDPIYIIHEVEIDNTIAKTSFNLYDDKIYDDLVTRIIKTIDIVHGRRILINSKKNHTGLFLADISNYVIGYTIGTDLSQDMVAITNMKNNDITNYSGKYFSVDKGTSFECLVAEILEKAYYYELDKYKTSKLYSFSSIVETDPFNHYNETNAVKNATTDMNNIESDNLFASIVAYPDSLYYLELGNSKIGDSFYYDYLVKYKNHYHIPLMVSNIGISSSRGKSNITFDGKYDRGCNNEMEQADELIALLERIDQSKINGVGINSFQDDWGQMTSSNMKNIISKTKNNYWYDAMSSDEAFGLMSFKSNIVTIDGNSDDFKKINSSYKSKNLDFRITSDSAYLYLYLKTNTSNTLYIGFDIIKDIGSKKYKDLDFKITNDYVLEINNEKSELFVNKRYDIFTYNNYFYDNILGKQDNAPSKNISEFNNIYLLNQKKLLIQTSSTYVEGIYYNTGKFSFGTEDSNSLTDYYIKDDIIEIRIPWNLINIKNPLDKIAQGDFYEVGISSSKYVPSVSLQVKSDYCDSGVIKYKIPNFKYMKYNEHLKESYYRIKDYWEVEK